MVDLVARSRISEQPTDRDRANQYHLFTRLRVAAQISLVYRPFTAMQCVAMRNGKIMGRCEIRSDLRTLSANIAEWVYARRTTAHGPPESY